MGGVRWHRGFRVPTEGDDEGYQTLWPGWFSAGSMDGVAAGFKGLLTFSATYSSSRTRLHSTDKEVENAHVWFSHQSILSRLLIRVKGIATLINTVSSDWTQSIQLYKSSLVWIHTSLKHTWLLATMLQPNTGLHSKLYRKQTFNLKVTIFKIFFCTM